MDIPSNIKLYEHAIATLWFDTDGILHSVSKSGPRTMVIMKDYISYIKEITNNKKVCILSDITKANPMDKETREFTAAHLREVYKAMALLSNSSSGELVGKVFLQLNTQPYPIRMFAKEEDAKKWLRELDHTSK